ncbi:chitinase [Demequina salsinemoris]|uniref:chitinase n=1 Tax=Demequina salsinemoris TaxID=577470 RepID=UPI0007854FA3|nr:carbohydrate-binding protein [Demequina salsinemoris]
MTAQAAPRTRVSFLRVGVALGCAAAVGWGGYRAFADVLAAPVDTDVATFAAYVDATVTPTYSFGTPSGPSEENIVLSFVVAGDDSCTPMWGGAYTLDDAADDLDLERRISQLRSTGGDVSVSFGGQAGTELAVSCTDTTTLAASYAEVVDRYDLSSIDLDIEGTTLTDTAAGERRAEAIKTVQDDAAASGESLDVWLTLPVAETGLTADGLAVVEQMLEAGVDLAGVNGMTMDFGTDLSGYEAYSDVVVAATQALHDQIEQAYADQSIGLGDLEAWDKVGITPMIGQNDIEDEVFTLEDAAAVNEFAKSNGVGRVSMWSLNRDSTCTSPLPTELSVVQTDCSGIDQDGQSFAEILSDGLEGASSTSSTATTDEASASATASASASASATATDDDEDDPASSPYPIWDAMGEYPAGTKIVWHHYVYEARYWTSGFAPDTEVDNAADSPWELIGPVLEGDTPEPLATVAAGTYPEWDEEEAYSAGDRVVVDDVPYEAKWWNQGQEPGTTVSGGNPWVLVIPE